ncbi:MAG: hypothetical protein II687_06910, partial [Selenomonadaceae bacterium]|nr:hypothetical protein [Selenomonadaceae bacterium]
LAQMLIVVCMVVFSAQVAFASADRETIYKDANDQEMDLASIHRLAIGLPLYTPVDEKDPTKEEITQAIYDASKVARSYVISYDEAAESIKKDAGVDIKALDRHKAAPEFKKNIAKYADAYVIVTVANNRGITCFYDIYKSGSDDLLYTYQVVAARSENASVETYKKLSEQFFKSFERSAEDQQKKAEKEAKKK